MGGLDVMIYDSTTGSYSNRDLPYDISASALKKAIDKSITGFENI